MARLGTCGRALLLVPARIRHGRPLRLVARALAAALLSLLVLALIPGQASGPAVVTGLVIWFCLHGPRRPGPATRAMKQPCLRRGTSGSGMEENPVRAWPLPSAAVVPPLSRADRPGRVKRENRALDPARPARFSGWRDDGDGMDQAGTHYALDAPLHERPENAH